MIYYRGQFIPMLRFRLMLALWRMSEDRVSHATVLVADGSR